MSTWRGRASRKATWPERRRCCAGRWRIDPELAKTHFFLGTALKSLGRYDEALEHLRKASAKYPRDRVVLNQLGRVLFLQRQYGPAVEALKRVHRRRSGRSAGALQPDARVSRAGQAELAAREEALYRRFKADEASQAITGPYRQLHPDDNNERQSIHEHVTVRNGSSALKPSG